MPGRERDEESGKYTDSYSTADILDAIRALGGAAGTRDIAEEVGSHRDTVRRRLNELAEAGDVTRTQVGNAYLWSVADD